MMAEIEVTGNTYAFRKILKARYNLRWNRRRNSYYSRMDTESPTLRRLRDYCREFKLTLKVNGTQANTSYAASAEEDDFDSFLVDLAEDESQELLGKIGGMPPLPGPSENGPGFHSVSVNRDDEPRWDVKPWFDGTRFQDPRVEQSQVIPIVMDALNMGYENVIIECPTGSGKSALAMMIPKMVDADAYVATYLKGLQAQYMREMPFMRSVMGRGNYDCKLKISPGVRNLDQANNALAAHRAGTDTQDTSATSPKAHLAPCRTCGPEFKCDYKPSSSGGGSGGYDWWDTKELCDYFSALAAAQKSRYFISNTSYLMALGQAGSLILPPRDLLIIDEAHHLPNALAGFYAVDLNNRHLERLLGVPSFDEVVSDPNLAKTREKLLSPWKGLVESKETKNNSVYPIGFPEVPSVTSDSSSEMLKLGIKVWQAYLEFLANKIGKNIATDQYTDEKDLAFAYNYVAKLGNLISSLEENPRNWVWSKDDDEAPTLLKFQPIDIGESAEELFLKLGKQRIFMSATIPSPQVYMEELGLDPEKTFLVKVNYSSFPTGNRPIVTTVTGGKMSYAGRDEKAFNQTAEAILQIINLHSGQKGLILPHTNEIEEKLLLALEDLDPTVVEERLLTHSKEVAEREEVLAEFEATRDDAVLISTYVGQGYDGKHCDFCIIVKMPFPPLGDIRTLKKMEANDEWYKSETAGALVQMCGRVVRAADDTGITYIIDPTFDFHYRKGFNNQPLQNYVPEYFNEAII
jgi:Rad3-related DNA helicase